MSIKDFIEAFLKKIPDDYYTVEIGKAKTVTRRQPDVSIITYGMGVHWAKKIVEEEVVDAEIIDLRTLLPFGF